MQDTHITLAHGNGGRYMRELIEELFARYLGHPDLDTQADAARLPLALTADQELLITTDGFTVQPLEFPGGSIGSLAVHGTVNDLAVSGAQPLYLTLNAFIEEGFSIETLARLLEHLALACRKSGVRVLAGDTKVLRRGEGGGLYLATTGIGVKARALKLGLNQIRPGDQLLVSGPVGDHGVAVLLAREQFGMRGNLCSDADTVLPLTQALLDLPGLRFMRDPTRGGLATVCHEIIRATSLKAVLQQTAIPIRDAVRAVCEILGYDPLFLACEGRVIAVLGPEDAAIALKRWRSLPLGEAAQLIGEMTTGRAQLELLTELGGRRILDELEDEPLPRIC